MNFFRRLLSRFRNTVPPAPAPQEVHPIMTHRVPAEVFDLAAKGLAARRPVDGNDAAFQLGISFAVAELRKGLTK